MPFNTPLEAPNSRGSFQLARERPHSRDAIINIDDFDALFSSKTRSRASILLSRISLTDVNSYQSTRKFEPKSRNIECINSKEQDKEPLAALSASKKGQVPLPALKRLKSQLHLGGAHHRQSQSPASSIYSDRFETSFKNAKNLSHFSPFNSAGDLSINGYYGPESIASSELYSSISQMEEESSENYECSFLDDLGQNRKKSSSFSSLPVSPKDKFTKPGRVKSHNQSKKEFYNQPAQSVSNSATKSPILGSSVIGFNKSIKGFLDRRKTSKSIVDEKNFPGPLNLSASTKSNINGAKGILSACLKTSIFTPRSNNSPSNCTQITTDNPHLPKKSFASSHSSQNSTCKHIPAPATRFLEEAFINFPSRAFGFHSETKPCGKEFDRIPDKAILGSLSLRKKTRTYRSNTFSRFLDPKAQTTNLKQQDATNFENMVSNLWDIQNQGKTLSCTEVNLKKIEESLTFAERQKLKQINKNDYDEISDYSCVQEEEGPFPLPSWPNF
ncbi:expressed protein [Phakopsora pachyrhizi]|uniref:Expressed protein n=1 Tax=Phakopsora pachyrhizi TaxID=170000 RepID=A0AAV0BPX0_PHAPC|nr:expressed protein [Phakopsora pachyrhizi]